MRLRSSAAFLLTSLDGCLILLLETQFLAISNTGNADATGVSFTDLFDPNGNLIFVDGSLRTTPIARPDAYSAIGNVSITIPAASGVLANDSDPDGGGPALSVTPIVNGATSQGGVHPQRGQ